MKCPRRGSKFTNLFLLRRERLVCCAAILGRLGDVELALGVRRLVVLEILCEKDLPCRWSLFRRVQTGSQRRSYIIRRL